ncbi:MAG: T9SS type A sorting domain-containing protein [Bacteroidota bacterium]
MKFSVITFCIIFLLKAGIYSQQINNNDFEDWTIQHLYDEPDGFLTSNMWTFMSAGTGTVLKVTDSYHGTFAARLETILSGTDTSAGMMLIGMPGNQTIDGGIPFTSTPDSVSAYIKYDIQPNDTAFFIVGFKKNGIFIGQAVKTFVGSQTQYARFSVPTGLDIMNPPDSMVAIITCSSMDPPQIPGSTMTLDSISFINSLQEFPNGSFETWTSYDVEEPDDWTTLNFAGLGTGQYSVTKSADSYHGSFALSLESVSMPWGDTLGFITNGTFGGNGPEGGMPVSANPMKVTGYYKYTPVGNDTAQAGLFTFRYDSPADSTITLEMAVINLTSTNTYTYFEIPLTRNLYPLADTLNIIFTANKMGTSSSALGSVLLIDSLNIIYYPLPVNIQTTDYFSNSKISVFPNPADDIINVKLPENLILDEIKIYNSNGQIVRNVKVKNQLITMNIFDLPSGLYYFQCVDLKGNIAGSDKFVKN